MRRQLCFDFNVEDNKYIIQEAGETLFSLNEETLKFISLDFYKGIYAGNKSTAIDFVNKAVVDQSRKGRCQYIFQWIYEIIKSIEDELPEDSMQENDQKQSEIGPITEYCAEDSVKRCIPLFEWPACAGNGLYFDQANVPFEDYEVEDTNADYAVKISGNSMEPTIADKSIVLVKRVNELSNGDIGIFSIDGEIMCKRYCIDEGKIFLKPDNTSGKFSLIEVKNMDCTIQGKVLRAIDDLA